MIALAIDTSTAAQVIGLRAGASDLESFEMAGRTHSKIILPSIMALLAEAGIDKASLDLIIFGQGPGSFTGLRIAVGVVQGLAYGLDIPVIPLSTLACIAQGEFRRSGAVNIVVAQSARKREVFFGSYTIQNGLARLVGEEGVFDAEAVPRQPFDTCVGVGDGWQLREQLEPALGVNVTDIQTEVFPRARDLLDLGADAFARGETVSALDARPKYLREQVATPNIVTP